MLIVFLQNHVYFEYWKTRTHNPGIPPEGSKGFLLCAAICGFQTGSGML
jgi:hypothetical protein